MDHFEEIIRQTEGKAVLCAVTKKHSPAEIMRFYDRGQRIFAENRTDELKAKAEALPEDISWHFIGHLQRNKVRTAVRYASCIQSLDSPRLADEIEKECARLGKVIDVLIEVHLASQDEHKTGIDPAEAPALAAFCRQKPHIRLAGMMVMGPHTDDEEAIRDVFRQARKLYEQLRRTCGEGFSVLSMGMSDDYRIALECGSTMVRIGTYLYEQGGETD